MRENMQKLWQWIQDRKTNTIRKWRSSMVRNGGSEDIIGEKPKGRMRGHSYSAVSLPSSRSKPPEYEQFFEEPEIQRVLEVRRQSFRESKSSDTFPVVPPDLDGSYSTTYNDRLTPNATPRTTPKTGRSPRQIRFQIPEVRVSFEDDPPLPLFAPPPSCSFFDDRRSPIPPAEIEWTPYNMDTIIEKTRTPPVQQSLSFDVTSDASYSPSRRNSASEKARQNLLAQRRQSNVQLVQSMTGRRTSTTIIPLTCAQIHLIRSLWRQIYTTKGPTVIGSSIYHRLCFKCPVVKEQIRRVPLPVQFQNHDSFVKAHSKAMAELIDQVVENLDNLDSMTEELMRIGRAHARTLRGELTGKLWNVVAETFIDCTLEWGDKRCRSETVRKAWALIVAFVIEKIKLGHHEQRKLMLATRQSMPSIEVPMSVLNL